MYKFFEKLKENVKALNSEQIKTVFTIATTSKQESDPYLTPIRKNNFFIACGCVIFDQSSLTKILKIIDGSIDLIFVDSEKKIPVRIGQNIDISKDSNLFQICLKKIHKSKIFEYKPSDITVNATWSFLSQRLNYLSGKKISILGCGNIGSKLALKLVESDAVVSIYRRNNYKGYYISKGINLIKPENNLSNVTFNKDVINTIHMSDVIVGASNGISVIDKNLLKKIKNQVIVIDLGKNTLTKDAIQFAQLNNIEIYRTDITSAFEAFIYEALRLNDLLSKSYGIKDLGYCSIIGGGYFGKRGDIVVDNITHPTTVFGVAAGDGTMKKKLSRQDKEKIIKLKMKYNKF
jgi:hypothetical protein